MVLKTIYMQLFTFLIGKSDDRMRTRIGTHFFACQIIIAFLWSTVSVFISVFVRLSGLDISDSKIYYFYHDIHTLALGVIGVPVFIFYAKWVIREML